MGKNGAKRATNNHLADCWKMNEVLGGTGEEFLDNLRIERATREDAERVSINRERDAV